MPVLSSCQKRIVDDMRRDGIAFSTLSELFPGMDVANALIEWTEAHKQTRGLERKKDFLLPFWSEGNTFEGEHPFLKLALSPEILGVVNSYDRMFRRLNMLHYAETLPVGENAPVKSQKWHRDPQELRQVKFFVYLSNVDSESGPFTYVKGSQYGDHRYGNLFPQALPFGSYPDADELERQIEKQDIVSAEGLVGTVIFCDTSGLHRGGHAKSRNRLMFTSLYPSMWWTEKARFTLALGAKNMFSDPASQFALNDIEEASK